jgi:hypothetical protein
MWRSWAVSGAAGGQAFEIAQRAGKQRATRRQFRTFGAQLLRARVKRPVATADSGTGVP